MATTKISDLSALTSIATDDEFVVVDKSDTTSGASGTTKKITNANFLATIQGVVDLKAPITDPTFIGEIGIGAVNVSETELGILEGATLTTTELNYVDGVTSDIQTQLNTIPTDLTDFTEQTAWRVFYSDSLGDVTELALGADGTFLKSNGATSAPTFAVPAGSGDVVGPASAVDDNLCTFDATTGKLIQDSGINISAVTANTAKVTNATHTGEVTGATALTIANNVVDEANLKLDESPTNDYVLTADSTKSGGMKWAAVAGSGTVTSVAAGNGLDFTTITGSGSVTLGTPATLTGATSNGVTTTSHTHSITTAISDNSIVGIDSASVADNDYAKFTSNGLEGRSYSEVRTDLNVADGANAYVHPNHSGDVTSVGDGAQTIANDAVTYAKMQNVVNDERVLGRISGADGVVEELTKAQVLTMLNVEDGAEANNISDVNATDLTDGGDTTLHDHDGISENTSARHTQNTDTALGSGCVAADHGTAATDQVVNVCYGTSATPPTASTTTEGTLYIQYTA